MPTIADPGNHKLIAGQTELRQAREAIDQATLVSPARWITTGVDGATVALPLELSTMVTEVLRVMARGGTVTVGSMPRDVTTTTAADLLGVSRPTLMKMVAEGALPATKVGSHTRLRSADVMEFRRARLERQRAAFDELLDLEDGDVSPR